MGLPSARNTTYAHNQMVQSADLNAFQDAVVDKWTNDRHGPLTHNVPPSACGVAPTVTPPIATDPFLNPAGFIAGQSNGGIAIIPIPLIIGEKVTAVTVWAKDVDAGHKFTAQLFEVDMATGVATARSNLFTSSGAGTIQACALANITAIAVLAGKRYEVVWTITTAGVGDRVLYGAAYACDHA